MDYDYRNRNVECGISNSRKGKEKAKDSACSTRTAEARWPRTVHGAGYCDGSCQPGPSCILFPRRPDGKVILPDPRGSSKPSFRATSFSGNVEQAHMSDMSSHLYHGNPQFNKKSKSKELETSPSSSRSLPVENYAQLSSLPEFKAFRMHQTAGEVKPTRQSTQPGVTHTLEGNISAGKGGDPNPDATKSVDAEWQQWKMREIRVVRRRRKQEYIRSGTHDFSIRLWSNYEA